MSTYTRTSPSDGTAITAAYMDGELSAIETAVNDIDDTNIGSAAIGNAKLTNPKAYFALHLKAASVGASEVITNRQDITTVPVGATLVAAKVVCTAAGAADGTVDIYKEGGTPATILTAPVGAAAALTSYNGSLATTAFTVNDLLSLRATTSAGGSYTNLDVVLLFKTNHVS